MYESVYVLMCVCVHLAAQEFSWKNILLQRNKTLVDFEILLCKSNCHKKKEQSTVFKSKRT